MADILTLMGNSLRQLASWVGLDVNTLVIILLGLLGIFFFVTILILYRTIKMKIPSLPEPPAAPKGDEPAGLDYVAKTLMEFPSSKVNLEANVDRLVFKLMETEPKVVEKIVEVPAEQKGPEVEKVDFKEAGDLNAAVALVCKKYGMNSLTIADENNEVVLSNAKDPTGDAQLAKGLKMNMDRDSKRLEIKGKPSVYLYQITKDKKTLSTLFRGADKDPRLLDMIPKDLELLKKFL
ncbi:MAG: hypothetical protein V3V92_01410, partial [Candidatus Hydrothermarchaeales archaeon]